MQTTRLVREIAKQLQQNAGDNCGIGAGGFEEGNTCAGAHHGTSASAGKKIFKGGIRAGKAQFGGTRDGKPTIYLSSTAKAAKDFSSIDPKTKQSALVYLKPGLKPDKVEGNTLMFHKDIPPEMIDKVEIYQHETAFHSSGETPKLLKTLTRKQK